ncbi:prenyltransferase [Colwelliaceae bacterium 6441]
MNKFIACLPSIRPRFLLLAPFCVLLGQSIAYYQGYEFHLLAFVLTLIGALFSAIAVNTLNEYQDFISGLDLITSPTPFSGGSGLLKVNPSLAKNVLALALISSAIVIAIGLYFIVTIGKAIIPLGILGLLIIATYTKWLNKEPILCLIAPGLGFGILMVVGSYFTQTSHYSSETVLISLIPFFLVNNLLLLNQFPDIDADQKLGRNHLSIKYGTKNASWVFLLFTFMTIGVLLTLVSKNALPYLSLLCLVPIALNFIVFTKIFFLGKRIAKQPKYMILNVISANLTPFLLAITLFVSS